MHLTDASTAITEYLHSGRISVHSEYVISQIKIAIKLEAIGISLTLIIMNVGSLQRCCYHLSKSIDTRRCLYEIA